MTRLRTGWVLALCVFAGCECSPALGTGEGDAGDGSTWDAGGGRDGGAVSCLQDLEQLVLSPPDQTVTVGLSPTPLSLMATARRAGSPDEDVTSRLDWSATREDDTAAGRFIAPGTYQPEPGTGGVVTVSATDGCRTATTTLTLKLEATFHEPGPAVLARFGGPVVTGGAQAPSMVYPSDQTRFPRNIYKILFQWRAAGNDWFRLTFAGPYSTTIVFTEGKAGPCLNAAGAGCFEADAAVWQAIAGSNAGEITTVTLDGVRPGDPNVYRAATIDLGFSRRDVKGAVFYWSTTAAGIRRASVSDADPEPYVVAKPVATQLPNNAGAVKCVACHTVSRSGAKMFAYTQAGASGGYVYDVALTPPPTPVITTQITTRKGFGTFRPDDARVVATVEDKLAEFDADTGAKIAELPVPAGTNPDWSPTGAELVYSNKGGDSPGGAALAVIAYQNGAWTTVRELVAAAGLSNLFPSYSPTGEYVAYARGKGGHGDLTAQLFVVRADGSGTPIELVKANRVVNGELTGGQHENNMPTWAPPGDYDWIAFNSVRPYGVVYPNGGTQQIWVAAIDRQKLAAGEDPSFPAFRFAFQGLTENNHRAFWTLDVRDPPDGGSTCANLGESCDSATPCCLGTECVGTGELAGGVCQPPNEDGGMCIPEGGACDQTSGAACCGTLVCDHAAADAGTTCRGVQIN